MAHSSSLPGRIREGRAGTDLLIMNSTATGSGPSRVMEWLADGLPLALLVDLFVADRLDSSEVMRREGAQQGHTALPRWPYPAA